MKISIHDETSIMLEAIEALHIGSDRPTPETGGIRQETRNDNIGIQSSNDIIQIV